MKPSPRKASRNLNEIETKSLKNRLGTEEKKMRRMKWTRGKLSSPDRAKPKEATIDDLARFAFVKSEWSSTIFTDDCNPNM
ncbi:35954_t:CDS:2 [Gigaspora margarita]|uniref:35954_t:CDS:1 n=1 Tax=Gigaspora margarita TaxID=4874 RepID=A0ABN7UX07_GIGMA|nr:35954_t:CDS:2 [Gigaspora margarita]